MINLCLAKESCNVLDLPHAFLPSREDNYPFRRILLTTLGTVTAQRPVGKLSGILVLVQKNIAALSKL
jgi:hypothetical protein